MMTERSAKLTDVAKLANVSLKTASRALNSEPYVAEETASKVLRAAISLRYRPNPAAQNLRRGVHTDCIGVEIDSLRDHTVAEISEIIAVRLQECRFRPLLAIDDLSGETIVTRTSRLWDYYPAQVISVGRNRTIASHANAMICIVTSETGESDIVVLDERNAGSVAAQQLIDSGSNDIWFVTDQPLLPSNIDRKQGCVEIVRKHERRVHKALLGGLHQCAQLRHLISQLGPTSAVITTGEKVTQLVMWELVQQAVQVPVIAVDAPLNTDALGLTGLVVEPQEIADQITSFMLSRLIDPELKGRSATIPYTLKVGSTTTARDSQHWR